MDRGSTRCSGCGVGSELSGPQGRWRCCGLRLRSELVLGPAEDRSVLSNHFKDLDVQTKMWTLESGLG